MNINELLTIIASENKLKIIAHYYNCTCKDDRCVGDLQNDLKMTQSNLSKHLTKLKDDGILDVIVKHKERVYSLNKSFKKQWGHILEPIINEKSIGKFMCDHCK